MKVILLIIHLGDLLKWWVTMAIQITPRGVQNVTFKTVKCREKRENEKVCFQVVLETIFMHHL